MVHITCLFPQLSVVTPPHLYILERARLLQVQSLSIRIEEALTNPARALFHTAKVDLKSCCLVCFNWFKKCK